MSNDHLVVVEKHSKEK